MLLPLQRELKDLLRQNRPDEVFRRLREEVLADQSELFNDAILIESRYQAGKREGNLGLIDFKEKSLSFNNVSHALIWLIDRIQPNDLHAHYRRLAESHIKLSRQHTYTCDRVEQSELVQLHYYENQEQKIRHFYLHGDARQSMDSLHQRLGYELGGHLLNWRDRDFQPTQAVKFVHCKPKVHRMAKLLLINLHKELLAQFHLDTNRNILQRKLAEVIDSPVLRKAPGNEAFGADDFVFVLITLDHLNWNERVTPEVVKTFVEGFCACELPATAPNFFFFYGIEYRKDDHDVQASVEQHIEASEHGEKLPPLTPVSRQDVAEWFSRYDVLLPGTISPDEMAKQLFPEREQIDMIEVETKLQALTDRHNKGLLPDL